MIKFDSENKVQDYTFILSKKDHTHLGQLRNIDPEDVISKINFNSANELSLTVYKYNEAEAAKIAEKMGLSNDEALKRTKEPLWDEIVDFKYIFVKELNEYYDITVENNDEETQYKAITGTSACEVELSQTYVYDLEINTELDIARDDYVNPTIFYNEQYPKESLLHRALYKLPQYTIKYVDSSLIPIQRTFSADGEDVYSFLTKTVAEEIGCLFIFDSVDRTISVYDLKTYCVDCGHRGEFSDVCPKCGSTSLKYYGEDTTIYIDSENLAEDINLHVDTDSVKNCFKLEAGDDNMTAAVTNLNPNGSSYIYYFSEEQKHEMPNDLVDRLESYDELVASYEEEYEQVMKDMYEAIDKIVYYTSSMMPTREDDPTNSTLEAAKLTEENLSPLGLPEVTKSTSTATVNAAVKQYANVFIKTGYFKVEVNEGEFEYEGTDAEGYDYGYWYGNFKVTNYSDEEDVVISESIKVTVNNVYQEFLEQKIEKLLASTREEDGSIYDVLSIDDLTKFKEALTLYCLNRLTSFYDALQSVIDIMIEEDQANENADLYESLYVPYYEKLVACQEEIDVRQATIDEWGEKLDAAEERQAEIQKALDFEAYLGEDMYKIFCCYKREDKYSNENYISDGLDNNEIFERARQFLDVAKEELVKSGEHQRQISSTLLNLLAIEEFKPLKDKFQLGNFIRIGIDGRIYRLRLISYQISFGNIQNIDVEFSDVTKIKGGSSDLQSILNQASSMASTYGSVSHQVDKSKKETDRLSNWVTNGLDATSVKIVNNADNQNITIGDSGLLARRKDDFTERYEDYQVKLISNGLYTTSNSWRSVDSCIGKYYYDDPDTGERKIGYGVLAKSIVGQLILGSALGIYSQDGSAEMSFDNFGLRLNTIDNGSGEYKRILDIQKDGISQLYIDTDGNIVLATDQFVQVVESIDRLNAQYADIENLYVSNATIENLLVEYAKIEQLEAMRGEFKELVATDAEIENLKAGNVTITGKLTAAEAEIDNLKATKVEVGELDAYKATIENLFAAYASIEYLEANYIKAAQIEATYAKITELEAVKGSFETLEADVAKLGTLVADKADITDLNAINATVNNLTADVAEINKLVATKVDAEYVQAEIVKANKVITDDLTAIHAVVDVLDTKYATIDQLNATKANLETLIAEKATIEELNAAKATIGQLDALVANINTILAGNVGTGTLQAINLTAQNVNIDDAVIKDLIAAKINVSDLKAGTISTDKFVIQSDNGGILISGSTMQFKDKNNKVRLQVGQDAQGNFNFIVFGEDGTTAIYNENGITQNAVPDGLIVDKMVSDNASIQGKKLDIDSVITEINDNNATTIRSTKIWIDEENQSLGAKFDSIEESINTNSSDLTNFITQTTKDLDNLQGQIDGSIQTFFYDYVPTNTNIPASEWTTTDLMNNHLGDLFYDTLTGYCYRWQVFENEYSWQRITDVDVTKALADAAKAQDTADNKRRVFVDIPTPPYDVGDLWSQGSTGDLMRCKVAKTSSQTYDASDWEKASKYTDDTKANEVDQKVVTLQTDFVVEQGKISSLISETETIKTNVSTAQSTADSAVTKADNAQTTADTANSKADAAQSNLTSLTDRYNQTVQTVEGNSTSIADITTTVNDLTGDVESMDSRITNVEETAEGLEVTVSKIRVGTRNLIYNTDFSIDQTDNWATFNANATISSDSGYMKVVQTAANSGCYAKYAKGFEKDKDYVVSFVSYASEQCSLTYNYIMSSDTSTVGNQSLGSGVSISTEPTLYVIKFTANNDFPENSSIMLGANKAVTWYFKEMMCEEGTINSSWTVAPEDDIAYMSSIEQKADKIGLVVESGDSDSSLVLTPGFINAVSDNIVLTGKVTFESLDTSTQEKINTAYDTSTANNATITAWVSDAINEGVTQINGGYIQTQTISSDQLIVEDIFAEGTSVMNIINSQEINADRITGGLIRAYLLELYGLRVLQKTTELETLSITDDGEITMRGSVESYNYIAGKMGWAINSETDDAEFNNVTVRGSVITNDGGIVGTGGTSVNLQINSSFTSGSSKLDGWYRNNTFTVDTSVTYQSVNSVKFSRSSSSTPASSIYIQTKTPVACTAGEKYTASAKFYTENKSGISGSSRPLISIYFYDADGNSVGHNTQEVNFENNEWVINSVTCLCPDDAVSVRMQISYNTSPGTFWFVQPKLEEGDIVTQWSPSPNEGFKQVRFWAGASYEERESAPWIVYSDGSMKSTKGEFTGVVTGEIEIGNISIIDPSKTAGSDAILTIQNGDNGIKKVQLSDTESSSFAQNVIISDDFYNTTISLNQDGTGKFNEGVLIGDNTYLKETSLVMNGFTLKTGSTGYVFDVPQVNIGSSSSDSLFKVYGESYLNGVVHVERTINYNDVVECTVTSAGLDFNFIN